MRILPLAALAASLLPIGAPVCRADFTPDVQRAPAEPVWQAHLPTFSDADYAVAVEKLMAAFEKSRGRAIAPGAKKKVGLKIYSDSGPGMATPVPLVRGVIAALQRRGYANKNIFLVGLNQLRLRTVSYTHLDASFFVFGCLARSSWEWNASISSRTGRSCSRYSS